MYPFGASHRFAGFALWRKIVRRILNVGQCGFDHSQISQTLAETASAKVDAAPTAATALQALGDRAFDLILVNRILDGDGSSGVEFI
jgi:hypothetical protein